MILKMMLDFDDFEGDAGTLPILKIKLEFDNFESDAGFGSF